MLETVIPVLGSIAGDVISNIGAAGREREARDWNKQMWDLQNAYNHPTQQMARLQEAGLNPRLIYGQSSGGATGSAGSVAPGKAPDYKISGANAIQAFNNTRMITAQTQNLEQQKKLNQARTIQAIADSDIKKYNLEYKRKAEENLLKALAADTDSKRTAADRALVELGILTQQEKDLVSEAAVRVENLYKEGQIKDQDLLFATWRAEMAGKGINVNDPVLLRTLVTLLNKTGVLEWLEDGIKNYIEKAKKVKTEPIGKPSQNASQYFNPDPRAKFGGFRPIIGNKF